MDLLRAAPPPLVAPALPRLLTADTVGEAERLAELEDELLRLRPGIFATTDPNGSVAIARRDLVLARTAAAWANVDSAVWFSHETAAVLRGMWTYRLADRVHLTQLYPPQVRREDDSWEHRYRVTRHWTALPPRDRDVVGGLPVTSLERTAADCARSLPLASALVVMDCALHHGADRGLVARIIDESRGKRGVVQARQVFALADAGAESPGESLVRLRVIQAGLPRPVTQVPVVTARGTKWVDLGWPDARVGLEFDGEIKYTALADGDPEGVRRRERVRQAAIEDQDWRIVRSDWPDVDEPAGVGRRLRRALKGRWQHVLGSRDG